MISGSARGRRLAVPDGRVTRPTSDRAREGLFSTLQSLLGPLAGRAFADLYAGSGAVGLEAASRGATTCLLVEQDQRALRALRANVAALGLPGVVVRPGSVGQVVGEGPGAYHPEGFDAVFLDPPYDLPAPRLQAVVAQLAEQHWLAPGAVVVVERASRDGEWGWPAPLRDARCRRYGEATLWYGRAADPTDPTDDQDLRE